MISMQQLEELESRVIKALQLIGDLRVENSRLENANEKLQSETEEAKLALEDKEQEVIRIQRELDEATRQLADLKEKEDVLEKKIISLLGRMEEIHGGGPIPRGDDIVIPAAPAFTEAKAEAKEEIISEEIIPEPEEVFEDASLPVDEDIISIDEAEEVKDDFSSIGSEFDIEPENIEMHNVDEDIIIIDDENELAGDESIKTEDVSDEFASQETLNDDEIILLDDEDEITIEEPEESPIVDELELPDEEDASPKLDDDDDFIIIEEDQK